MEKVWQAYKDRGVVFIGVNIRDTEVDAQAYVQKLGVTSLIAYDITGEVATGRRVSALPITFIMSKNDMVWERVVRPVDEETLVRNIEALVAES